MSSNTIPVLSIIFMGVSALIGFGLPVGIFLFWRKKYELKIVPALTGAAGFIVFAMVLEQLLHFIVLKPGSDGTILLASKPFLYTLYGTMAAGVFEETARFLCFHLLKKKYRGLGTGLAYGIGHGGVEAILLLGFSMISNLFFSIMVNAGNIETLGNTPQLSEAIETLQTTASSLFLVGGLERIFAVTIHISLSVLVWFAVNKKGKAWLYPAAILLHALIDVPAALMQFGVLTSIVLTEGIVFLSAVLLAFLAVMAVKHWKEEIIS